MKKMISVLLCAALIVVSAAGCNKTASNNSSTGNSSSSKADSSKDVSSEPEKRVSIEIVSGDSVEFPAENFMNLGLSEAIGADITYTILGAGSDYTAALNVRLTGGDIPDLFVVPGSSKINMRQYVDNGLLMSLSPYLDELQPMFDFTGEVRLADMYNDELYLVPKQIEMPYDCIMLREDWVTTVGGKHPTTPQEMLDLAKLFTSNDPDGNGKNDTYGFSGKGLGTFNVAMVPYGCAVSNYIRIIDGKVTSSLWNENMKDALAMAKSFVDSGVVDPDIIANTTQTMLDKANQGQFGMTSASYASILRPSNIEQAKAVNPNAEWTWSEALTGPAGTVFGIYDKGNTQSRFVIGKHVEDDNAKRSKIFELLNYVCSEDGNRLVCYGVEGRHFNLNDNKVVPTDLMTAETQFAWAYQICGRNNSEYLSVKFPEWDELVPFASSYPHFEVYNGAIEIPDDFYSTDFNKYVSEEITKFIYGQRAISEYDKFLEELNTMFQFDKFMVNAESQLQALGLAK